MATQKLTRCPHHVDANRCSITKTIHPLCSALFVTDSQSREASIWCARPRWGLISKFNPKMWAPNWLSRWHLTDASFRLRRLKSTILKLAQCHKDRGMQSPHSNSRISPSNLSHSTNHKKHSQPPMSYGAKTSTYLTITVSGHHRHNEEEDNTTWRQHKTKKKPANIHTTANTTDNDNNNKNNIKRHWNTA